MRALRALALVAVLALVSAGCGDDAGTVTADTTTSSPTSTTETTSEATATTVEPAGETVPLSAYFIDAEGHIALGWIRQVDGPGVAAGILESVLAGTTADDEPLGLTTAIPAGTTLLGVDITDDATAVVDLSAEFVEGGSEASGRQRLAQIVYAVTQFPTVEQVEIRVEGEVLTAVGETGVAVDGPLARADFQWGGPYEDVEDRILVEMPRPGEVVEGPAVDVGGSSNTFEATVQLEAVAVDGTVLVPEQFTTATSGSGTPGTFYDTLVFPDGTTGQVVIRVFESSAEDGSRVALKEIPITLE